MIGKRIMALARRLPGHARLGRCVLAILMLSIVSCAPVEKKVGETITTRINDPFLRQHITMNVSKGALNAQTSLYEVDASIAADRLDAQRPNSYRIMVRAAYFQGAETKPVDTSQWSELILRPNEPVEFRSASLTTADRCLLEVAYPEEVGMK